MTHPTFLASCSPAVRAKYEPELALLARTHNMLDNVAYFRRLREHNLLKARLCTSDAARRTWYDLARHARREMVAALRVRRAQVAKFGVMAEGCMTTRQAC